MLKDLLESGKAKAIAAVTAIAAAVAAFFDEIIALLNAL